MFAEEAVQTAAITLRRAFHAILGAFIDCIRLNMRRYVLYSGAVKLGYQSTRHTVMSSHGQLVTGELVTDASHHTVNSSQAST